ncbi:hypothetical protein NIES4073_83950 [Kalymmatonema gypsitolerans NIES-4073]|nr:hypothetical protein NIES4073_83950 [Scytonema sp. NIES-4073]
MIFQTQMHLFCCRNLSAFLGLCFALPLERFRLQLIRPPGSEIYRLLRTQTTLRKITC